MSRRNKKLFLLIGALTVLLILVMALYFSQGTRKTESERNTENQRQGQEKTENQQETTEVLETETGSEEEEISVTISAVGDCTLGRNQKQEYTGSFDAYYDQEGGDYFFSDVEKYFWEDDFTVGNCEGVLSDTDTIRTSKQWNHKGKPEYAAIFANASFEGLTLGNNHIMDYESQGVTDTENNITDYGMKYAISSVWDNHYGMFETDQDITIGFVSVNEYYEGDACYTYLSEGLSTLREEGADLVLACVHWGGDKVHTIEEDQITLGHWCIDQGYDLVLGCHPHVLQGIECYQGKYIVYSMGNFCYGGSSNPEDKETMIFQATFTFQEGNLSTEPADILLIPCRLSSTNSYNDYHPVVLEGEELTTWTDHMNTYCQEFGLKFGQDGRLE